MSIEHPFPLDDATRQLLLQTNGKDQRPVWERYHNTYHTDPQPDEWPHTVECFAEWYRRHAGLLMMGRPILDEARAKISCEDPLEELIYTFVNSMEKAFEDLRDLIEWAIVAWEFDPLLCEVRNPSPEETEEEPESSNVITLPTQS